MRSIKDFDPVWRYNIRKTKVLIFDYKVLWFFLTACIFLSSTLFMIFLGLAIAMYVVEFKLGYTIESIFKRIRVLFIGKYRPAVSNRRRA